MFPGVAARLGFALLLVSLLSALATAQALRTSPSEILAETFPSTPRVDLDFFLI